MIAPKGQCCFKCSKCDGFACYQFSKIGHWLDAKIRLNGLKSVKSKKELRFITLLEYGKKYCKHFHKRAERLKKDIRNYSLYIDEKGEIHQFKIK